VFVVTEITPVDAPAGTITNNVVGVEVCTTAVTPLKVTRLSVGVISKFEPIMVTRELAPPESGEIELIDGGKI
jgi:hypothetical protein